MLSVGQIAPDFVLPNQDGTPVRLSDQRGKKVIIFAFPAANTAGCTAQACGFRDALPQFENAGAIVFGISADKLPALQKFKRGQKLPYDLLSDENHAVLDAWSAWGKNMLGLFTLPIASRSYWVLDE
ncbi:MAG: peroxiredoxin, partial [Anaerolineae bacterium]|nr:peroxiredoxin [Anaerolineae bacterium]